MYEDEECKREDHVNIDVFKDCPRCDSKNIEIRESLKVWEYCDRHHLIDAVECLDCDAIISIDLLMRLNEADKRIRNNLIYMGE
jgi:hypothetical protein